MDLTLPTFAHASWTVWVFIGSTLVFHAAFVWKWPLGAIGWKRVDYVWLPCTLVGILGAVGAVRQTIAGNYAALAEGWVKADAATIRDRVKIGRSDAVCRKFIHTEFSPPEPEFSRMQAETDAACSWFSHADDSLKVDTLLERHHAFTLAALGSPPPKGGNEPAVTALREAIDEYNVDLLELRRLLTESERSDFDWLLASLGPTVLAVGLGLRLTKVTGEIQIERSKGTTRTTPAA